MGVFSRVGIAMGCAGLPFATLSAYDYFYPFPGPLNMQFPLIARYHIRRALWSGNLKEKLDHLDRAMSQVISAGIGPASPQANALLLYTSDLHLKEHPIDLDNLQAAYQALTFKPHVGEGIREEKLRLEMSFKVAECLIQEFLCNGQHNEAKQYLQSARSKLHNAPPYLTKQWHNLPAYNIFYSLNNRIENEVL